MIKRKHRPFHEITFRHRVVGMGLGGLPIAVVMVENSVGVAYWGWWIFSCYLWPWLALRRARNSSESFQTERQNLTYDSFIAGSWASLLHFNLLPAAMLVIITTADKISCGINRLWLYSLPFVLAGMVVAGAMTGFAFQPITSMPVILASLPILGLHTLSVSYSTFQLVRKVNKQNKILEKISQTDFLTGLLNRGCWQKRAIATMEVSQKNRKNPTSSDKDGQATLVLIDVDQFKAINDTYGHSVGDDVLKAVAEAIRKTLAPDSDIARLGGDEFAAVVPASLARTETMSDCMQREVAAIRNRQHPGLRCGISVGMAEISPRFTSFRQWFDQADKAMYAAKLKQQKTTV
jgi:diguanylate cyclase